MCATCGHSCSKYTLFLSLGQQLFSVVQCPGYYIKLILVLLIGTGVSLVLCNQWCGGWVHWVSGVFGVFGHWGHWPGMLEVCWVARHAWRGLEALGAVLLIGECGISGLMWVGGCSGGVSLLSCHHALCCSSSVVSQANAVLSEWGVQSDAHRFGNHWVH